MTDVDTGGGSKTPGTPASALETVLGALWAMVFFGGIAIYWAWKNPTGQAIIKGWWWVGVLIVAGILIALLFEPVRRVVMRAAPQTRVGLFTFVVLPTLVGIVAVPAFLPESWRVLLFRCLFVVVVCLVPGSMYYLFVAARRQSLINEFVICLDRLGLLTKEAAEKDASHQRRIVTYLDKFEAVYGPVPPAYAENLIARSREGAGELALSASRAPVLLTFETGIPVLIATVLITTGWWVAMPPLREATADAAVGLFAPERTAVNFAFLGAYFFSLQMLFRRYIRRDLQASAYASVSLRIVLAVIATWVFFELPTVVWAAEPATLDERSRLAMAFMIGAFPSVFLQALHAFGKRIGSISGLPQQSELPLHHLDGLTVWHQARLEEEDIENIPNFATADIVELILHTRFPADRVVDWVDQAILYTALGPETDKHPNRSALRAHGIRGAVSLLEAYRKSMVRNDLDEFEKLLPADGRRVMRSLVDSIESCTNLRLLEAWHGLPKRQPVAVGLVPSELSSLTPSELERLRYLLAAGGQRS